MVKRKAEVQLTSDNPNTEDSGPAHDLKDATPEQLKERKIIRARRRNPANKPAQPQNQSENQSTPEQTKPTTSPNKEAPAAENGEEKKPETKKLFSFGAKSVDPSKPFSFGAFKRKEGGEKKEGESVFKFNFGKSSGSSTTFGLKSGSESFGGASAKKWQTNNKIKAEPKLQLKGAAIASGEEDEETVYETRSKLYKLAPDEKDVPSWKERGIGILKVNKGKSNNTTRLLMRVEKSLRLILNLPIFSDIGIKKPNEKSISLVSFDQNEEKPESLLLKFPSAEACAAVLEFIESGKKQGTSQDKDVTKQEDNSEKEPKEETTKEEPKEESQKSDAKEEKTEEQKE